MCFFAKKITAAACGATAVINVVNVFCFLFKNNKEINYSSPCSGNAACVCNC